MGKDNNQRQKGELTLLSKQSSNSCFISDNTSFSAPQAYAHNTSVMTAIRRAFLFSKDNTKPNFCPSTDQPHPMLDLRSFIGWENPFHLLVLFTQHLNHGKKLGNCGQPLFIRTKQRAGRICAVGWHLPDMTLILKRTVKKKQKKSVELYSKKPISNE